jgi:hypothetical protein
MPQNLKHFDGLSLKHLVLVAAAATALSTTSAWADPPDDN